MITYFVTCDRCKKISEEFTTRETYIRNPEGWVALTMSVSGGYRKVNLQICQSCRSHFVAETEKLSSIGERLEELVEEIIEASRED